MSTNVSFVGLLIVVAVSFAGPFLLELIGAHRIPAVVPLLIGGIIIGPSGFGWVKIDAAIHILSLLGLAFILFLAGLEVELHRLRGRLVNAGSGFLLSFGLALLLGYLFFASGEVKSPLLIAIILVATSLGVIVPLLKDAGQISSDFGQFVIAHAMIAQFGSAILLSLFFSQQATTNGLVGKGLVIGLLLGGLILLAVLFAFLVLLAERSLRLTTVLLRLQDTSAQIRVRGAFMLLVAFAALAELFGLDAILGAFLAGVILKLIDADRTMTHPRFHQKLEAIGFGVFVPIFVVTTGLSFDLSALLASPSTILRVPLFLFALLFVRGIPALLYRFPVGNRRTLAGALFQATSFPFIVAAAQIGVQQGLLSKATSAALITAGALSVLIFPACALVLLRRKEEASPSLPEPAAKFSSKTS